LEARLNSASTQHVFFSSESVYFCIRIIFGIFLHKIYGITLSSKEFSLVEMLVSMMVEEEMLVSMLVEVEMLVSILVEVESW